MPSIAADIQPQTHALERYIQASVEQLLTRGDRVPSDGLLFLGNWHDAMPRLIFQDPVLQPVDTRVWGVIKIAASGAGPTAFPTYKRIAAGANVGSDATVARAMAILRATRWLSLCRRVRDAQGRFRGNVYALHDEPLPLPDALHLDQRYMPFLEQACTHNHPQVRKVAAAVLATITEDLQGDPPGFAHRSMERRLVAMQAVEDDGHRFFAFSSRQLQNLKAGQSQASLQNLKSAPLQKLKRNRSSSSYIYKNTTTTETTHPPARARNGLPSATLAWPPSLSANERYLAQLCLNDAPAGTHQDIMDEWTGRLQTARRKNRPIENPIGYLAKLCNSARAGRFTLTSLGLRIRERRDQAPNPRSDDALCTEDALTRPLETPGRPAPPGHAPLSMTFRTGDGTAEHAATDGSAIGAGQGPQPLRPGPDGSPRDGTAIGAAADRRAPHPVRDRALAAMHAAVGRRPHTGAGRAAHARESRSDGSAIGPSSGAEPSGHTPPAVQSDGTAIVDSSGPPVAALNDDPTIKSAMCHAAHDSDDEY